MNQEIPPKNILLSKTSILHYVKLVFRSCLFFAALIVYIMNRIDNSGQLFNGLGKNFIVLGIIWLIFIGEMLFRFFPSKWESMGCQKQFSCNFKPTVLVNKKPQLQPTKITLFVAFLWIVLNAIIGTLYCIRLIDDGIILLICLAFSVADMICILFFCPFQTWIMKNKCCGSCRIYNWDYAMMFTPLIFVKSLYTWSILVFAIALLAHWEVAIHRHPERFSEVTNACLSCTNCTEKLCQHKKQLQQFLKKNRHLPHLSESSYFMHEKRKGKNAEIYFQ